VLVGIIWLHQWSNPKVEVSLQPGGGIVFLFRDRGVTQIAWPRQPTSISNEDASLQLLIQKRRDNI